MRVTSPAHAGLKNKLFSNEIKSYFFVFFHIDDQIGYGIPSGGAMRISMDGTVEAISMPLYLIERKGDKIAQINDLAETN
jgi:hypothetical protein